MKKLNPTLYYILSLTWGLPLTLIGLLVAWYLMAVEGKQPKRCGGCWYFVIGDKPWGGLELGLVFLIDSKESVHTKWHEYGHSVQNIIFGPLTIFLCWIPSICWYWYREIRARKGNPVQSDYDSFWVEHMATQLGYDTIDNWENF